MGRFSCGGESVGHSQRSFLSLLKNLARGWWVGRRAWIGAGWFGFSGQQLGRSRQSGGSRSAEIKSGNSGERPFGQWIKLCGGTGGAAACALAFCTSWLCSSSAAHPKVPAGQTIHLLMFFFFFFFPFSFLFTTVPK